VIHRFGILKQFIFTVAICVGVTTVDAQIRVVNYNIHYCSADLDAMKKVFIAAAQDDTHGEAVPVSMFVFQEVSKGKDNILHGLIGDTYSKGTYTNQGESGGAQAMFYNSTQLIEVLEDHNDIYTGATRNADRWHVIGIGENKGVDVWVYSAHLKASTGTENKTLREAGVKAILEDIATLPEGSHVIVVGDMNFYTVNEPAYTLMTQSLIDPLGTDEWAGTDNAMKHTQSPRKIRVGGLASGGLDDRFDFQFISKSLQDGKGLELVRGSYHALGNDGKHYDVAINDGKNEFFDGDATRSNSLALALHDASDHIPVIADYEVVEGEEGVQSTNTAK
jgi:endonuclease/exonuclease/phosphatase family metal-dependent hydrolase